MTTKRTLKYIKHKDIDYNKWDRCIISASNSRVYATSWYLDRTATNWDALVYGDYEYIMPLPIRSKLFINYLYQPVYSQQLGIYPAPPLELEQIFFSTIIHNFYLIDIQLNSSNLPPQNYEIIKSIPRKNFLLSLVPNYNTLVSCYNKNTNRNIAKANNNRLSFSEDTSIEDYLTLKQKNLPITLPARDILKLKNIISYSRYKGFGKITGIYTPRNKLCAAAFFLRWKNRIIYLNSVSDKTGKELRAMFLLIDQFLKISCEKNLILDFEGSMLPGIAQFFKGFGASPETYYHIYCNQLPYPIKLLQKIRR